MAGESAGGGRQPGNKSSMPSLAPGRIPRASRGRLGVDKKLALFFSHPLTIAHRLVGVSESGGSRSGRDNSIPIHHRPGVPARNPARRFGSAPAAFPISRARVDREAVLRGVAGWLRLRGRRFQVALRPILEPARGVACGPAGFQVDISGRFTARPPPVDRPRPMAVRPPCSRGAGPPSTQGAGSSTYPRLGRP